MLDNPHGIGASPLRKEDARHLAGRGRFVADVTADNALHAAILRSQVAHGHLKSVTVGYLPKGFHLLTAED